MASDQKEDRVLQFFPVINESPRTLSREQIADYNEKGYLKPFNIFTEEEAEKNRQYFDGLLEQVRAQGLSSYSINGYETQCAGIWDIAQDDRILDPVEDLLGPNFVCWGTHYFCKLPNDPKAVHWHQDAPYWPLSPSKTITVWLAIDDVDRENSAMKVIPGSHRMGVIDYEEVRPEDQGVLGRKVTNAKDYGEPVYMELRAGQISLHSDMLLHGSDSNQSSRRRGGLTLRYAPVDVRGSWNTRSSWCRGQDPAGHWANLPRPNGENLAPKPWQKK